MYNKIIYVKIYKVKSRHIEKRGGGVETGFEFSDLELVSRTIMRMTIISHKRQNYRLGSHTYK